VEGHPQNPSPGRGGRSSMWLHLFNLSGTRLVVITSPLVESGQHLVRQLADQTPSRRKPGRVFKRHSLPGYRYFRCYAAWVGVGASAATEISATPQLGLVWGLARLQIFPLLRSWGGAGATLLQISTLLRSLGMRWCPMLQISPLLRSWGWYRG